MVLVCYHRFKQAYKLIIETLQGEWASLLGVLPVRVDHEPWVGPIAKFAISPPKSGLQAYFKSTPTGLIQLLPDSWVPTEATKVV